MMQKEKRVPNQFKRELRDQYSYIELHKSNRFIRSARRLLPKYSNNVPNPLLFHIISNQAKCFVRGYQDLNIIVWDETYWDLFDHYAACILYYSKQKKDHNDLEKLRTTCFLEIVSHFFGYLAYKFALSPWLRDHLLKYQRTLGASDDLSKFVETLDTDNHHFFILSRFFALYHELAHIVFRNDQVHFDKLCTMACEIFGNKPDWYYQAITGHLILEGITTKNDTGFASSFTDAFKSIEKTMTSPQTSAEFILREELAADLFALQEMDAFLNKLDFEKETKAALLCQVVTIQHNFHTLLETVHGNWDSFIPKIRCQGIKRIFIDASDRFVMFILRNTISSLSIQNMLLLNMGFDSKSADVFFQNHIDFLDIFNDPILQQLISDPAMISKIIDRQDDTINLFI